MSLEKMFQTELEGFPFGFLQDVVTLLGVLESKGISLEELRTYVRERQEKIRSSLRKFKEQKEEFLKEAHKCPLCGALLLLAPVTIAEGPANRNGY